MWIGGGEGRGGRGVGVLAWDGRRKDGGDVVCVLMVLFVCRLETWVRE